MSRCRKSVQHNDDEQAAKKVGNAAESFLIERVNLKVLKSESILGARCRAQIGMTTPRATVVVVNLPVAPASLSRVYSNAVCRVLAHHSRGTPIGERSM